MSATNTTNLIVPRITRTDLNVDFAKNFGMTFGGMADMGPVAAGHFVPVRGFNELSGDDERMTDGGTYSTNNLTTYEDVGVILHRLKKFGAEDLGAIISGMEPTAAINRMISKYFVGQTAAKFISVLKALFATSGPLNLTNLSSVYVDSATAGDRIKLTPSVAAVAAGLLGDNMMDLGVWLMHSATYATLLAAGYLETNTNLSAYNIENGMITTFVGKPVVVADSIPGVTGTNCPSYRTYYAARGSLFLGVQKDLNPEQSRDSNKIDIISTDFHYCAHVRGCKWNSATTNPTNAELETATNWALAYSSAKQVRVVAIDHNI
jgi:hypothetical protein